MVDFFGPVLKSLVTFNFELFHVCVCLSVWLEAACRTFPVWEVEDPSYKKARTKSHFSCCGGDFLRVCARKRNEEKQTPPTNDLVFVAVDKAKAKKQKAKGKKKKGKKRTRNQEEHKPQQLHNAACGVNRTSTWRKPSLTQQQSHSSHC